MPWNSDPSVRALAEYSKKFGFIQAIVIGIEPNYKHYKLVSYGKNAKLCKAAKNLADQINGEIQAGKLEVLTENEV